MGFKQLGHGADHPSPFTTKVKNVWDYTSAAPYVLMVCGNTGTALHCFFYIMKCVDILKTPKIM
jgi:hypothetical protein